MSPFGQAVNETSNPRLRPGLLYEAGYSCCALAVSLERLKGAFVLPSVIRVMPGLPPFGAVFDDPIRQCAFESDVVPRFFGFDPFVAQDLLAFRLELAVQSRVLQKIAGRI